MLLRFIVATTAITVGAAFAQSGRCELAINGGFETGNLTSWTLYPSTPGNIAVGSPGFRSSFAGCINNTVFGSSSLIKNANIGVGTVLPGELVTIAFDAKGQTASGGVAFAEFFSELTGGGTSKSVILGGGPLALDPDPNTWKHFSFTTTAGPDVSGGVTLQLAAITGAVSGSLSSVCFDNASVTVARTAAAWTNYGTGWAGANGVPKLQLDANPILGQTINILLGNASGASSVAGLFLGHQQTTTTTPFGGTLLVNLTVTVPVPALTPGGGSIPLRVPNASTLCGLEIYGQLLHADPAASAGLAFSRGLRIAFGL